MRYLDDGGNILDLHGHGPGALAPYYSSVCAKFRLDLATCGWRIVAYLHSESAQNVVRQFPVRAINAFRQKDVVAGLEQGQMNQGNCALPPGSDEGAEALLQFANFGGQFQRSWCSIKAVGVADLVLVPVVPGICRLGKQNG